MAVRAWLIMSLFWWSIVLFYLGGKFLLWQSWQLLVCQCMEREREREGLGVGEVKVGGVSGNYWRGQCLLASVEKHIPNKTARKKSSTPWISLELCRLIRKRDRKCHRVKKQGTDELKAEVKELMREVQKNPCQSSWNYPHLNFWEDTLSCRLLPQLILPKDSEGLDFRVQASSRGGWWWAGLPRKS